MKARSWSALAADRPVATWMATVAIVVFGLVSLGQLPLALLPDLSYPTITVRTTFDGAENRVHCAQSTCSSAGAVALASCLSSSSPPP